MKVCLITNLYEPIAKGGAENVVKQTAEGLVNANHEVFIITTSPDRVSTVQQKNDKLKIYRFKPMNLFYYTEASKKGIFLKLLWHFINIFNFQASSVIEKILLNEKPDIIMTHNLMGVSFQVPKSINKLGIRHFHILHDVQLAIPSGLILKNKEKSFSSNGFLTKIYAYICKRQFKSPDVIISPSKWLLNFYKDKGFFEKSHQVVLANPLDLDIISDEKNKKNNKYLFIGQLEKHKGIEWLINFWNTKKIKSDLLIVGNGNLKFKSNKFIKILGRKNQQELIEILTKVDFLIVPSLCYENSPTVIPLSYSQATPVIASTIGGIPELIEDARTGYLFETENVQDFKIKLKHTLSLTNKKYQELSKNCRIKANSYDINEYIKKLENL